MGPERSGSDPPALVAFVHIPKTAGTTLNSLLFSEFAADERHEIMMRGINWIVSKPRLLPKPLISFSKLRRLKSAVRHQRSLRIVHGHFDLSIKSRLPPDTRYFTLMRDPVERAISHYHHFRRRTIDAIHPLAMKSSLADWVSRCGLVEMDNGQTRRLAGEMNLPCGRVTSATLERAKSNLAEFAVVGLTERFEESLTLVQRAFGWSRLCPPNLNVAENRMHRSEVDAETLRVIERCNRFDLDLYRFARGLFEQAIGEVDAPGDPRRLRAAAGP